MAQTKEGAIVGAAKKIGISVEKYIALTSSGLKRCTKCKLWKKQSNFHKDKSRFDGLKAKCIECVNIRQKPISKQEFAQKQAQNLKWCCECFMWFPDQEIKQGRCAAHRRQYERDRYKNDAEYRFNRKQKTSIRRRNVEAVPPIGEEVLRAEFEGLCAYCDNPATTYDHIIPVSKGGKTNPGNIVPACLFCNSSKKDKDVDEWLKERGFEGVKDAFFDRIALAAYWVY